MSLSGRFYEYFDKSRPFVSDAAHIRATWLHFPLTVKGGNGLEEIKIVPYTLDTALTGYMPLPRELLEMDLPSTAILIYGTLLDRATLSQKNDFSDCGGWVYVIYPLERLADTLHISDTAVKRHLRELEGRGLIRRRREVKNGASHIYLCIPSGSMKETNCTGDGKKLTSPTGRKVPTNNKREQHNTSNYYQHREEESL